MAKALSSSSARNTRATSKAAPKRVPTPKEEPAPRRALGRGLSSLIPPAAASTSAGQGYRTLPIERLKPNSGQPRKHFDEAALAELTHSIRTQGVLQPIIVRKMGDNYEIVAGERRWRAAGQAGLREVPTIVKDLSDSHALQVALIENIQRHDLDPLEEAQSYRRLIDDHALTHEALAEAVGKNRVTISNSLRLLNLPQAVLDLLVAGKLTAGHVRPLMTLGDEKMIVRLAEEFAGRKISVRDAEVRAKQAFAQIARGTRGARASAAAAPGADNASVMSVVDQLQRHLNTKVQVRVKGKKGSIEIQFHNFEALDDILEKILQS